MTDPYRDDLRRPTGPNPWGVRLLVTIREWAWPVAFGAGVMAVFTTFCAFAWGVETRRERECSSACDAIGAPVGIFRDHICYCVDDQGRAREWPKRAEDDDCER